MKNPSKASLPVMECFYSLQGEGYHTGKAAFFMRIGGCDIGCSWCDVKASWNSDLWPAMTIDEIINEALKYPARAVVVTGGEPLSYDLDELSQRFERNGYERFLETSGCHPLSGNWNWICLSPKKQSPPLPEIFTVANELKVIISENNDLQWAESCMKKVNKDCKLFLQPEWSVNKKMMPVIIDYIKRNPIWSISLQSHKFMQIP